MTNFEYVVQNVPTKQFSNFSFKIFRIRKLKPLFLRFDFLFEMTIERSLVQLYSVDIEIIWRTSGFHPITTDSFLIIN